MYALQAQGMSAAAGGGGVNAGTGTSPSQGPQQGPQGDAAAAAIAEARMRQLYALSAQRNAAMFASLAAQVRVNNWRHS